MVKLHHKVNFNKTKVQMRLQSEPYMVQALMEGKELWQILDFSPDEFLAFTEYANELYNSHEFEKAGDIYYFLAFAKPSDPTLRKFLGFCEFGNQKYEDTINTLDPLLEEIPNDMEIYLTLAHAGWELNEPDVALYYLYLSDEMIQDQSGVLPELLEEKQKFLVHVTEVLDEKHKRDNGE